MEPRYTDVENKKIIHKFNDPETATLPNATLFNTDVKLNNLAGLKPDTSQNFILWIFNSYISCQNLAHLGTNEMKNMVVNNE